MNKNLRDRVIESIEKRIMSKNLLLLAFTWHKRKGNDEYKVIGKLLYKTYNVPKDTILRSANICQSDQLTAEQANKIYELIQSGDYEYQGEFIPDNHLHFDTEEKTPSVIENESTAVYIKKTESEAVKPTTHSGKLTEKQLATVQKILTFKLAAEANVVSILYKKPDYLYDVELTIDDISNNAWKVFFQIIYDIIILEKKQIADEITIGLYLEKHPKLKAKYEEYGGYNTVVGGMGYVKAENFYGYYDELKKWKCVLALCKSGFPIEDDLSVIQDKTASQIYSEYQCLLDDVFKDADSENKQYMLTDNLNELIDSLDKGEIIGLPFDNLPTLSKETNGAYLGSIVLVGGISNAGKTTFVRNMLIPSIIKHNEKIVVILNEDSVEKWQRELLVWTCNNILHYDITKRTVRNGNYSSGIKNKLKEAANWMKDNIDNKVNIVPLMRYNTQTAINVIRKYANMGVKYFLLDTFKADAGVNDANSWMAVQQCMVDLKDTVKASNLNVSLVCTFQLNKASSIQRYFTQDNIGVAKNIVDVASTCLMIRDLFSDELNSDGKHALKVYQNGKKILLDKEKTYQALFIVKNQEGSSNKHQIVIEHDKDRNVIKEAGICSIEPT